MNINYGRYVKRIKLNYSIIFKIVWITENILSQPGSDRLTDLSTSFDLNH